MASGGGGGASTRRPACCAKTTRRRGSGQPLLRSWGRDAREMQLVLAAQGVTESTHHRSISTEKPALLLARIQADIRADRPPPGPPTPGRPKTGGPCWPSDDDSLRLHSCHGRARQVEVVREAVLHLLADDPTLEPRDVIVMCPDIELFAPLVNATFGAASLSGAPELRARLADRSLRQTNPLLAVAAHLLDLAGSRVTASEVLDFASREPVAGASAWTPARRRFPGSSTGWPAPGSAGAWTRPTAGHGNWKSSKTVRGGPVSTASCWVWPWRRTSGCSEAPSRSATFPARTSTSPAAWPSWSTGWK